MNIEAMITGVLLDSSHRVILLAGLLFKENLSWCAQELDVDMFSLLVYPLRSRGKDGHFADAQIVSG